jgi:hypothetical protein
MGMQQIRLRVCKITYTNKEKEPVKTKEFKNKQMSITLLSNSTCTLPLIEEIPLLIPFIVLTSVIIIFPPLYHFCSDRLVKDYFINSAGKSISNTLRPLLCRILVLAAVVSLLVGFFVSCASAADNEGFFIFLLAEGILLGLIAIFNGPPTDRLAVKFKELHNELNKEEEQEPFIGYEGTKKGLTEVLAKKTPEEPPPNKEAPLTSSFIEYVKQEEQKPLWRAMMAAHRLFTLLLFLTLLTSVWISWSIQLKDNLGMENIRTVFGLILNILSTTAGVYAGLTLTLGPFWTGETSLWEYVFITCVLLYCLLIPGVQS